MPPPLDVWTDERVALLTKLWNAGNSASICMAKLRSQTHARFSRNAVIGKVARMKLARHPSGPRTVKEKAPCDVASHGETHLNRDFKAATPARKAEYVAPARPLPRDIPKTFKVREIYGSDLVAERCTYDETCPDTPVRGRFYCEAHCRVVYLPPSAPRNPAKPSYRSQPPRRT